MRLTIVVRQKTVRTSAVPFAGTRINRQRAFSTRTRANFERGTSEQAHQIYGFLRGWDSNPVSPCSFSNSQILKYRRCQGCQRCRRALPD